MTDVEDASPMVQVAIAVVALGAAVVGIIVHRTCPAKPYRKSSHR